MYCSNSTCNEKLIVLLSTGNKPFSWLMLNLLLLCLLFASSVSSLDFLFNSMSANDLIFTGDARIDSSVIQLTSDAKTNAFSMGRAFYPNPILKITSNTTIASFSTSFIFSILPESTRSPGFGLTFLISNSPVLKDALPGQYHGIFTNSTVPSVAPLVAIEFDCGRNPEFNDPSGNHIGIDLNNSESVVAHEAGYHDSSTTKFMPVNMRSGSNIRAWVEFDGTQPGINVTIAPVGVSRPSVPLISFYNPVIANYVSRDMFVGFSASRTQWIEAQRILAWSLNDAGAPRDINTSNLPNFASSPSSKSTGRSLIVVIIVISVTVPMLLLLGLCLFWQRRRSCKENDEEIQDWELEYWPHRFSYKELWQATNGFSEDELLGSGGFGRVYKGSLANDTEIAVKCMNQDSNQGLREFMAEISSIGRLQHKNLVRLRGWCKKDKKLMLVYDYLPNGSLYNWIFSKSKTLEWQGRVQVFLDVAEGLCYLHHAWDHLVFHRDIKSSNILLDSDMHGKLGDFGLAKLYKEGQAPTTTRVVGTVGYMAPELVKSGPTTASDVYSFGVVVLEVLCGRRPTEILSEDTPSLVEWVKKLSEEDRIDEALDWRISGQYKVEHMELVLKLGLACCEHDPQIRPTMKEAVAILLSLNLQASKNSCLELQPGYIYSATENTSAVLSVITEPSPRT